MVLSVFISLLTPPIVVLLEFPLPGDQSMGSVRSHRLSDWPHRLFHRHCGGGTGWYQIPSGQREYPEDLCHQVCSASQHWVAVYIATARQHSSCFNIIVFADTSSFSFIC